MNNEENIYEIGRTPYFKLLDGNRLKALFTAAKEDRKRYVEEQRQKYFTDKPMPSDLAAIMSRLPDMVSVAINPYQSEQTARNTLKTIVERMKKEKKARPWSVELYQNVECSIRGLLNAPYFIFLGMAAENAFDTFKEITEGLRSDCPNTGSAWENWSENQGDDWRGDRFAKLLERWVFLDDNDVKTFGV